MFAKDIEEKINRDFKPPDETALVLSVLGDFADRHPDLSIDRILRCIVFVADGDMNTLEQAIDLAKLDYRDLIVWAEYDRDDNRIRDLTLPFP